MFKRKSSIKKIVVTDLGIAIIICFVFICAFTPFDMNFLSQGPVMNGNTHGDNIALQISADSSCDFNAYMDALDSLGIKATFFFPEQYYIENGRVLKDIISRGNGVGYYICEKGEGKRLSYYIGSGVSVPVMSYVSGSKTIEVAPSIDISKLKESGDWQSIFEDKLKGDMFVYTYADNNLDELEKIVQIVQNKGYTILKMDQML